MQPCLMSKRTLYQEDYICTLRSFQREESPYLHYHDFYEIVIYLGQQGSFEMDGTVYELQYGDILLIDIFKPHILLNYKSDYFDRFSVCIDPSLIFKLSSSKTNVLNLFTGKNVGGPRLRLEELERQKYLEILKQYENNHLKHGNDILDKALTHQMLAYLYDDCYDSICLTSHQSDQVEMVSILVELIAERLTEKITLEELADRVNYSEYYICRIFKRYMNCTLVEYILDKRIEKALLLLEGEEAITQIALECGFQNYSYFYKTFCRKIGMSPAKYRTHRKKSNSDNYDWLRP